MARHRHSAAALLFCAVVALLSLAVAAADATGEVRPRMLLMLPEAALLRGGRD